MDVFWQSCLSRFSQELPNQQFSAWIKPLTPLSLDTTNALIKIGAPNRFKLEWAKKNFSTAFSRFARDFFSEFENKLWVIEFELIPAEVSHVSLHKPPEKDTPVSDSPNPLMGAAAPATPKDNETQKNSSLSKLIPSLDFDSFVLGKANNLAIAAASQVAQNPGVSYNPLYIYGGVGLGKTHLVHAIGNQILRENPHAKIRYIHAERYVGDVVRAYQRKAFDEFKNYYRNLDALLIDDIQFFSGKVRTQEEFFYAFEALIAANKQIIITSDTYPKQISGVDERLISRFSSGLTVAIEPPELEMRVAILQRKAGFDGFVLQDDVAFFVAKHVRSNVRELEGALRKIYAFCSFHGKAITLESAKDALIDILSLQNQQVSIENIQKTVADFFKIKTSDLFSKRRHASITVPRQIAMFLAKELTQKSLPEIGELFGGRDHTTVLHSVRKIAAERQSNPDLNHHLHVLEQTLKA